MVPDGSRAPAAGFNRTAIRQAISSGPRARRPFCMIPRGRCGPSGLTSSGPALVVFQEVLAPPGTAIGSEKMPGKLQDLPALATWGQKMLEPARWGPARLGTTGSRTCHENIFVFVLVPGARSVTQLGALPEKNARTGVESPGDRRRVRSPLPATPPRAGSQGKRLTDSRSSVRRARATTSGSLLAVPHSRPLSASRAARLGSAVSSAAVSVRP